MCIDGRNQRAERFQTSGDAALCHVRCLTQNSCLWTEAAALRGRFSRLPGEAEGCMVCATLRCSGPRNLAPVPLRSTSSTLETWKAFRDASVGMSWSSPWRAGVWARSTWRCTATAGMEKLCVVKTALPHLIEKGYLQRFKDEAKVVVRLSHGNLVGRVRRRPGQGRDLPRHGLRRGQGPARGVEPLRAEGRGLSPAGRGPHRQGAGARPRLRAHLRGAQAGPPRRLAAQRAAVLLGRGQADRLRPGHLDARSWRRPRPAWSTARSATCRPSRRAARPSTGAPISTPPAVILWELLTGRQLFAPTPRAGRRRRAGRSARAGAPARDRAAVAEGQPRAARPRSHRAQGAGAAARGPLPERRGVPLGAGRLLGQERPGHGRAPGGALPARAVQRGDGGKSATERQQTHSRGRRAARRVEQRTQRPGRGLAARRTSRPRGSVSRRRRSAGRRPSTSRRRSRPSPSRKARAWWARCSPAATRSSGCAARAAWAASTRPSTSRSASAWPSRSCTRPTRARRIWSSASAARRGRPRASSTPTSSTSPTSAPPPTARCSS